MNRIKLFLSLSLLVFTLYLALRPSPNHQLIASGPEPVPECGPPVCSAQ